MNDKLCAKKVQRGPKRSRTALNWSSFRVRGRNKPCSPNLSQLNNLILCFFGLPVPWYMGPLVVVTSTNQDLFDGRSIKVNNCLICGNLGWIALIQFPIGLPPSMKEGNLLFQLFNVGVLITWASCILEMMGAISSTLCTACHRSATAMAAVGGFFSPTFSPHQKVPLNLGYSTKFCPLHQCSLEQRVASHTVKGNT